MSMTTNLPNFSNKDIAQYVTTISTTETGSSHIKVGSQKVVSSVNQLWKMQLDSAQWVELLCNES